MMEFLIKNSYVHIGGFIFAKGKNLNSEKKINDKYFKAFFEQKNLPEIDDRIFFYSGLHFTSLKPNKVMVEAITTDEANKKLQGPFTFNELRNHKKNIELKSHFPAISYSKYKPIKFPDDKNYFEIFDFDPNY